MAFIRNFFRRKNTNSPNKLDTVEPSINRQASERKTSGRAYTWPVPYLSRIEGSTILPGQSFIIRGFVIAAKKFTISLGTGSKLEGTADLDDIVLQIDNRIDQKRIVLNSLKNKEWGKEIKFKCPFKIGEEFDYRVRAHENHFEIFTNHKQLCIFEHRQPLTSISHIYITGDVELYTVSWEGKYYAVPYEAGIPGNFYPGRKLYISGEPEKNPKQFSINLHSGNDIALHFNPRYKEKKIFRNSQASGQWAEEESDGQRLPLSKRNNFDIIIVCEDDAFRCYIDGNFYCTFKHRLSPHNIDKLTINGNVELQGVHLK